MYHRSFKIEKKESPVYLKCKCGDYHEYVFDTYYEFVWWVGRNVSFDRFGKEFERDKKVWLDWLNEYCLGDVWYVAEQEGKALDPNQIQCDFNKLWNNYRYYRRCGNHDYVYRKDPVPHHGRRHSHRRSWYRRAKTFSEARQSLTAEVDGIKWRSNRKLVIFDDPWDDDYPRHRMKNWKKFRKHQWKENRLL